MATWYEAVHAYPTLNILLGDLVRYDPGEAWPIEVFRCLRAEEGPALWEALAAGAVRRVSDDVQVEHLAALPAPALPTPADAASRRQAMRIVGVL